MTDHAPKQLLHLVFGGELTAPHSLEFRDLSKLDFVGMYPNYAEAYKAWRGNRSRPTPAACYIAPA